ncbi:MAG: hypothetical protein JSV78_11890 [Phycisphaerales bacterium]|nr:MAG: hypothetical protein JSV78_11890 [Phycisphaerales bacterium]
MTRTSTIFLSRIAFLFLGLPMVAMVPDAGSGSQMDIGVGAVPMKTPDYILYAVRSGGILYAPTEDDNPTFRAQVSALTGKPCDYFDAREGTPDAELLAMYDCVFTWVNYAYADRWAFSDALVAFADGGGNVILGQWAFGGFGVGAIPPTIIEPDYCPVYVSSWSSGSYSGDGTGCPTAQVESWYSPYRDNASLRTGALYDGTYTDGVPLFAFYPGVRVTYIPGALPDFGSSGDLARMVVNACGCPRDKGDLDVDGDIDVDDFSLWEECTTGPDGGPRTPGCIVYDFEYDGDVDLMDFAAFQLAFTG